jgi:hypothetical protein
MNLVELDNLSGPRVKRGYAVGETSSNRTTADDCSRTSADAEIAVRRYPPVFSNEWEGIERMGDSESLSAKEGNWKKTKRRKCAILAKIALACGTVRAGRSETAISTNQGPTPNPC